MKSNLLKFKILLLLLAVFFSSCDKEDFSIFNNPDKFRLTKKFTYLGANTVFERVYTYNETGNMIKEAFYDCEAAKILLSYTDFEYSENKKVKEKFFGGIAGNLTMTYYILYFYEGSNLVREEYYSGFDGVLSLYDTRNYEYNERGNLVRESWFGYYRGTTISGEGEVNYSYDEQNRLILKKIIDIDNSNHIKYIYTGISKLLEKELHYDRNGNLTVEYQHYYDSLDNLIETKINDECLQFKGKYKGKLLIEEIHYQNLLGSWGGCYETGMSKYEYEEL
jgi:hypothetical protein